MRATRTLVLLTSFLAVAPHARGAPALLRAVHSLDEPRGYCLDIPGAGPTLNLDGPLQAHTCKEQPSLDDQLFEMRAEQIQSHDRCLTAEALEPGSALVLRPCSDSRQQRWTFADGRVTAAARRQLCVTLAAVRGEPWGTPRLISPVYRRQALALADCDASHDTRQIFNWVPREEAAAEPSTADVQRTGMPADVAAALAAFGHEFDGNIAQQTAALYAGQPHVYAAAELSVAKDLAYGAHERQRLDVHTRANRPAEPVPVIVVFHGGGLIGGSRAATVNVAEYFASLGYVGVNGGYRLAPEAKWPEGARDVGAAVTWLRDHVAEYGGDPAKIFVAGISTGALHAATYVFRPELVPGAARPAGAILVSGPYTFDFAAAGRGELAYFGEDRSRWPAMVVPGNVTSAAVPVLMTTAEWDNERYTTSYALLFHELVTKHGIVPRYFQSLGHNHSSQLLSVGTSDTSVSSVIVDFIERTTGR
ncbi:MAG TPA: alpha/beta hydrolase fold domain-containing protein [Gammaproteobacteria bacterium]|nr:alpha/beta hydrolase fold domain-containing protein [Gammaproteobacteria bacterium]